MSSYNATRAAARARFFQEMGEAISHAERGRAIQSMFEAAYQAKCASAMKAVILSLIDISSSYQGIALQVNDCKEHLRILREDPITNATEIRALKKVKSIVEQHLAARKAHDVAYKAGLRNPAHADPLVLQEYVAKDGKAYMAMTTE